MNGYLLWVGLLGLAVLIEALLARHEVLTYSIGWRAAKTEMPVGVPYARGADPDRPPDAYVVYLDGIGKRRFHDSRDGGLLVRAIIAAGPELRVLGQVLPYSPLADPLTERPVWIWLRRRAGLLLFLHNVMQIFVAADRRYRPLYNRAVGLQISAQLRLAGYEPDSRVLVALLSYSGGAQVASGAVETLHHQLRCPIVLISIGGFHNGANDLAHALHFHELTSAQDRIERIGARLFPQRWAWWPSAWNRAIRAGKVSSHRLDPATHVGPHSYISPLAQLPDGRTHLARTVDTVIGLIRTTARPETSGRGSYRLRFSGPADSAEPPSRSPRQRVRRRRT